MKKEAAVLILNWNGKDLLEKFLPSVVSCTPEEKADIIVIDNASSDGSLCFIKEFYPEVGRIEFDENYGFAGGYNRAIEKIKNEYAYLVLLNSDVEVSGNWLESALSYMNSHPEICVLQPKILSYNQRDYFEYAGASGGYIDKYGYPFCRGRVLGNLEKDVGQYDDIAEILWASGACLFIKTAVYIESGGLDEQFFAHQEEIDLCWRIVSRGGKIICYPLSVVYHVGGATLSMGHPLKTYLNFRNNLIMLYKNLPEKDLAEVMSVRFLLDCAAVFKFILSGKIRNAISVLKARRGFCKMRRKYKSIRKDNIEKMKRKELPASIYRGSLLFDYYFRKRRIFSELTG